MPRLRSPIGHCLHVSRETRLVTYACAYLFARNFSAGTEFHSRPPQTLAMPLSKKPKLARESSRDAVESSSRANGLGDESDVETEEGSRKSTTGSSNEWQNLFQSCGVDMGKSMEAKRKRLESFTQASLKTTNRKVEEMWKKQQRERRSLAEIYENKMSGIFSQLDADLEKAKESDEKIYEAFKQQQKLQQQQRIIHGQRVKELRRVHGDFVKGVEEMEKAQAEQQSRAQSELRKEMNQLQRKVLSETHNEDMASVRKTLSAMLTNL
ncbi:synaptonemal complex protein 3-like isoform X2 [Oscarella lobularis]|uniref:synaptonemal complex protein 3-like isoform X2 n=1 Tax=Oscarella lobularis TaxID=121494 RepID=UPI0033138FE2